MSERPPSTARRRWLVAGLAVGATAAGAGAALWQARRGAARDAAAQPEQAFWSLTLQQPDGSPLRTSSLRGGPLLVNFWATWCPPCVEEMPLLDRFARRHADGGWQVLGIAVDQLQPVQEFLQRHPVAFPVALAGVGGTTLSHGLGNAGGLLPYSVVFDRRGRVAQRHLGAVKEGLLAQWVKAVG